MTITTGSKVKSSYGVGFVTEKRKLPDGRIVAEVTHPDGFKNWYQLDELEPLPYRQKFERAKKS